jgi:hypothetical protein
VRTGGRGSSGDAEGGKEDRIWLLTGRKRRIQGHSQVVDLSNRVFAGATWGDPEQGERPRLKRRS